MHINYKYIHFIDTIDMSLSALFYKSSTLDATANKCMENKR